MAMWLAMNSILPVVRYFSVTRKLFGIDSAKKSWWQLLTRGAAIVGLVFGSLFVGIYFSVGTNLTLDILKHFAN